MMPFTERLKLTFDALQTTPYKFAGKHGFNRSSMFSMLNGNTRPNLDMLERICSAEPAVSAEYLVRGEGAPLRDKQIPADITTVEQLRELKAELILSIDKRIQELVG